jgi:hypothetical protein
MLSAWFYKYIRCARTCSLGSSKNPFNPLLNFNPLSYLYSCVPSVLSVATLGESGKAERQASKLERVLFVSFLRPFGSKRAKLERVSFFASEATRGRARFNSLLYINLWS